MSLSFTVSTAAADRVAADLLAVPIVKGLRSDPAPTRSTPHSTAASPRSSPKPASRASSARPSRYRPAAG